MTIKDNNCGVSYAQITWLERFLKGHQNIVKVSRSKDNSMWIGMLIKINCLFYVSMSR